MKASIQQQVAPMSSIPSSQEMAQKPLGKEDAANQTGVDFQKVMNNSMFELRREQEAKEKGDFSTAKTEEEFFDRLAEEGKPQRIPKNKLDKDDFLKLFVAQLQHQDPLNPDDGAEMATKLAQFNGLEQMMNVNKTLTKMMESQNKNQNFQLVNYIGKEVTVGGGRINLQAGEKPKGSYKLDTGVTETILEIRDAGGMLVKEMEMGTKPPGQHNLEWDGRDHEGRPAPAGFYTYNILARNDSGETIPVNITSKAKITGIDVQSPDGTFFSSVGRVGVGDIVSVGQPGYQNIGSVGTQSPKVSQGAVPAGKSKMGSQQGEAPTNAPARGVPQMPGGNMRSAVENSVPAKMPVLKTAESVKNQSKNPLGSKVAAQTIGTQVPANENISVMPDKNQETGTVNQMTQK